MTETTLKSKATALAENAEKKLRPILKPLVDRAQPLVDRADQVLLGLSHSKASIPARLKETLQAIEKNPNDIVGRVSRSVLERAEAVRKQLIEKAEKSEARLNKRWVPDWLRDANFTSVGADAAASISTEAPKKSASEATKTRARKPSEKSSSKSPKSTKSAKPERD